MTAHDAPEAIRFLSEWLQAARAEGELYGPRLLARPVAEWRAAMDADPHLRSYGTTSFILEAIHEDFHQHPALGHERIVVILDYVNTVMVPAPNFGAWLRGTAWREYANALKLTRDPKGAIEAARKSKEIFDSIPGDDAAKAELVEAQALREIEEFDAALSLARRAAETFRDHGNARYYCFARMCEAWALFGRGQFRDAFAIFSTTANEAEQRRDNRTLALCLYNAAECARALGEDERGRDLNKRAVALLNQVGTATDTPRVRWAHALDAARHGAIGEAISELFIVQAEFLALGMNTAAASATLDVVRLKFERGEDIAWLCTKLVPEFSEAGMATSAIEALAYLREEAKRGTVTAKKIAHVQTHVNEVARMPALIFLPPRDEEQHP